MKSNVYFNFPNHKNLKKCNFTKKVPLLIGSPTPINRLGYLLTGSFRNPCIDNGLVSDKKYVLGVLRAYMVQMVHTR